MRDESTKKPAEEAVRTRLLVRPVESSSCLQAPLYPPRIGAKTAVTQSVPRSGAGSSTDMCRPCKGTRDDCSQASRRICSNIPYFVFNNSYSVGLDHVRRPKDQLGSQVRVKQAITRNEPDNCVLCKASNRIRYPSRSRSSLHTLLLYMRTRAEGGQK